MDVGASVSSMIREDTIVSTEDTRCPTPEKTRFATVELAKQRANLRTSLEPHKKYRVYPCSCGWHHLTTQQEVPVFTAPAETAAELLALNAVDFRHIVSCDVKNRLGTRARELLRTADVNPRWRSELRLLWLEALREQDVARDDEHRKNILAFQEHIRVRRQEAEKIRVTYLESLITDMPRDPRSKSSLRRVALRAALMRLCNEHKTQLRRIYLEEVAKDWPEGDALPERLPEKIFHGQEDLFADDEESEGLSPEE